MKVHILTPLFLFYLITNLIAGDYEDGLDAYNRGDYNKAYQLILAEAKRGNPYAQKDIALAYDSGQGVPQDYKQAAKWYQRSAKNGNIQAQFNLALLYMKGQGVSQNNKKAAKYFRKRRKKGI